MAGINQGRPELAVGEPIRLGNNDEFEIEQHPVSDRLIIRDTQNGKVAYVRKERGGSIGGDGVLIKALKEGKPMADDGRTYATIQQAERAANGWVFVPPGTYNESVQIDTDGLTLRGSGYNTLIDGGGSNAVTLNANGISIESLSVQTNTSDNGVGVDGTTNSYNIVVFNVTVRDSGSDGIFLGGADDAIITSCRIESCGGRGLRTSGNGIIVNNIVANTGTWGIYPIGGDCIVANNIIRDNQTEESIAFDSNNMIIIGNRAINSADDGINISGSNDSIVANNRVSDSTDVDIVDNGNGTLLDGNLTGASN